MHYINSIFLCVTYVLLLSDFITSSSIDYNGSLTLNYRVLIDNLTVTNDQLKFLIPIPAITINASGECVSACNGKIILSPNRTDDSENTLFVPNEEEGARFMKDLDVNLSRWGNIVGNADWNYTTNLTDHNRKLLVNIMLQQATDIKRYVTELKKFPYESFKDPLLKRQFEFMSLPGLAALPQEKLKLLHTVINKMKGIYGEGRVCDISERRSCNLKLDPDLTKVFANSRDERELKYYWTKWRNAVGRPVKQLYPTYVELENESARLNNYTDYADAWLSTFEVDDFDLVVNKVWYDVEPLYKELHAYVRRQLRTFYGISAIPNGQGAIPAHLLGNMWAQDWSNIYDITAPYPETPLTNITGTLERQNFNPLRMFKLAEQFFTSLGFSKLPQSFWEKSIFVKPKNTEMVCHASAWDFSNKEDFRIKMCTEKTQTDLATIHHEMGHIYYDIEYKEQPKLFRSGANPGFHEAIGDTITLSAMTPVHLQKVGLLDDYEDINGFKQHINFLFFMALRKVAFLPYGYINDIYRWKIFKGEITKDNYNCAWWQLRWQYQGLEPPVVRTEEDFDAGCKFHVPADVSYLRYFVANILQFQFHKALCEKAGQYNNPNNKFSVPLHYCDIYNSKEAGISLRHMLQLGSSQQWPDTLEILTGERDLSAKALMEYFEPLYAWLKEKNNQAGDRVGWNTVPMSTGCA